MRSVWFLVAFAVGAVIGSAAAAPRAGKVVRVERTKTGIAGHPRYCHIQASDMFGSCSGSRAPEIGDRMIALDRNRVIGSIRVTSVQPQPDGCQATNNWYIQTVADSGDFGNARSIMLGVADVTVDLRSGRVMDVDKTPTGHPWGTDQIFAVDSNGDGNADVEFIEYGCDDAGTASTTNITSRCSEVWGTSSGKTLERLRHDRFRNCY